MDHLDGERHAVVSAEDKAGNTERRISRRLGTLNLSNRLIEYHGPNFAAILSSISQPPAMTS